LLLAVALVVASVLPEGAVAREHDVLTNNWLVELNHEGGERVARSVAADTGFTFVAPVSKWKHFCKTVYNDIIERY
jgi:hypothetical protein